MPDFPWFAHYDAHVPHTIKYPRSDVYSLFSLNAAKSPAKDAVRFMGKTLSYKELTRHIESFAGALAARGVKAGDKVVLLMPNCPQFVIAYFALFHLGAVVVSANPLNVERELAFKFNDSGARAVIALDLLSGKVNNLKKEVDLDLIVFTSLADFLPFPLNLLYPIKAALDKAMPKVVIEPDARTFHFKKMLAEGKTAPKVKVDPESLAVLIYSGGTTGVSKGIMLSHRAMMVNAMQAMSWESLDGNDALLGVLPLFHGFGMSVCMNAPLLAGGTMELLPKFDAKQVLSTIHKKKPTLFAGVPTMFIAMKETPGVDNFDLTSLRGIFVGAAPLPLPVMREFEQRTGASLIEGYGLTEAVTAIACNPARGLRKPGTVGIPFPDVAWRIVNLEDGVTDMPVNQAGEIIIQCPDLMMGYYNQPELTAKTIRDGWLFTGDIGVMDEDGYVTIVDRKKDLVIVSGFNVFPSEIDEVLHGHPKVAEAVAVGLPHPQKGEYLKAYVVAKAGQTIDPAEIIAYCKQNLSAYMVPKEVEVRSELPKSMIGKVLRRNLREEEIAKSKA